ncbi:MAG: Holliday junction branch migration protein RuvA [Cytophagaceae bacterium]|nr:Holliday junction branch migration protein RuvA [Cytophagaceae bacterium]
MIAYIDGKLTYKEPAYVIVDVGGVGYEIRISLQTYSALANTEERVRLFTHLSIREDAHILFGFLDPDEKRLFMDLTSVSGIGPNTALVMLSSLSSGEIRQAVTAEDLRTIQGIKGIGAKTAQRAILELKDKFRKEGMLGGTLLSPLANAAKRADALAALTVMGLPRPAAEKSIDLILKRDPDIALEQLIRLALR